MKIYTVCDANHAATLYLEAGYAKNGETGIPFKKYPHYSDEMTLSASDDDFIKKIKTFTLM